MWSHWPRGRRTGRLSGTAFQYFYFHFPKGVRPEGNLAISVLSHFPQGKDTVASEADQTSSGDGTLGARMQSPMLRRETKQHVHKRMVQEDTAKVIRCLCSGHDKSTSTLSKKSSKHNATTQVKNKCQNTFRTLLI